MAVSKLLAISLLGFASTVFPSSPQGASAANAQQPGKPPAAPHTITYKNTQYGFSFSLPASWRGYSIVTSQWQGHLLEGSYQGPSSQGPELSIRHPQWTAAHPRQDIPIMVFTLAQWELIQIDKMAVSAAPIGPSELGRNRRYVLALPARYNFAYPTGYEEVEQILAGRPIRTDAARSQP